MPCFTQDGEGAHIQARMESRCIVVLDRDLPLLKTAGDVNEFGQPTTQQQVSLSICLFVYLYVSLIHPTILSTFYLSKSVLIQYPYTHSHTHTHTCKALSMAISEYQAAVAKASSQWRTPPAPPAPALLPLLLFLLPLLPLLLLHSSLPGT
jgi:hypothetical protein